MSSSASDPNQRALTTVTRASARMPRTVAVACRSSSLTPAMISDCRNDILEWRYILTRCSGCRRVSCGERLTLARTPIHNCEPIYRVEVSKVARDQNRVECHRNGRYAKVHSAPARPRPAKLIIGAGGRFRKRQYRQSAQKPKRIASCVDTRGQVPSRSWHASAGCTSPRAVLPHLRWSSPLRRRRIG